MRKILDLFYNLRIWEWYRKNLLIWALGLLLASCGGEKYDISNAIGILPDKKEAFTETPSLKRQNVNFDVQSYYSGTLTARKLGKLSGIFSNFEIQDGKAYYLDSRLSLIGVDLETGKEFLEIKAVGDLSKIKKSNVSLSLIAVSENNALVTLNNGYIIKFDLNEEKMDWTVKIEDLITIKPLIVRQEALVLTSSGGVFGFDLQTGAQTSFAEKADEPIGIHFNTVSGLSPIVIPAGNLLLSYYRTNILFFDLNTKVKLYSFPLVEGNLEFGRITETPILYRNLILAGTSRNITALSLANGIKAWQFTGNFTSNIVATGEFAFAYDDNSKQIVSFSMQNGDVKWKEEFKLPKKTSKVWLALFYPNALIAIDEKGFLTKLDLVSGEEFVEKNKQKVYSPKFNYKLIENRIYYTDNSDNLIILE